MGERRRRATSGVELTAKADGEGGVEERGDQGEPGGDQSERAEPRCESDGADDGEDEPDQLRELQRRHRFLLGDRREPRRDQLGEDQTVRVLARPACRTDREHHRLQAEDDRGGDEADARHQQRDDQNRRGDPRGEARTANVDLIDAGTGLAGRSEFGCHGRHTPVAGKGWLRAGHIRAAPSEHARSRDCAQQLQQQQQQPATRHRSTVRRLVSIT